MIDQTRAPSPQTHTEPTGATGAARQAAQVVPFQSWVTSGNGEEPFVSVPSWRGDKPAAVIAAAPVAAQVAASVADERADSEGAVPAAAKAPSESPSSSASAAPASMAPRPAAKPAAAPVAERVPEPVINYTSGNGEAQFVQVVAGETAANKGNVHAFAEGNEPTVWDLLDFINPLQHIPVVNMIYREITGDKIGALPQIVGGAILGGPIGAISAIVNLAVEETTGKDLGGQFMALLSDEPAVPVSGGIRQAESAPPTVPVTTTAAAAPSASTPTSPATEDKPRGHIEVMAPTPSTGFVPYSAAPANVLPAAQASAQAAKGNTGSKLKMPPRSTPTAPVTAASLGKLSSDAVKPAVVPLTPKVGATPPVDPAVSGAASSDGTADQEALATPGPPPAKRAISASDSVQPQANPGNTADFVSKFMTAMDKYDKAARLTPAQAAAAASTTRK